MKVSLYVDSEAKQVQLPTISQLTHWSTITNYCCLRSNDYAIQFVVVTRQRMLEAQRQYKSKDYVTDVLSFPDHCTGLWYDHYRSLGEIWWCPTAFTMHTVQFLYVHSLLHLLGYQHDHPDAEHIMIKQEDIIMSHLDEDTKLYKIRKL